MGVWSTVRHHVDEASYLYGLCHSVPERIDVTRFLLRKKGAQLRDRLGRGPGSHDDAAIALYGVRHFVDLLGSEIYVLDEIYRERLYDRVAGFVPGPEAVVVDVGANVGMFAVRQARRGAHVYAFEPNPNCYRRLSRALVENDLTDRVSVFNYAIGTDVGSGSLRVPGNRTALGSLVAADGAAATYSAPVRVTSLDRILPALGVERVDLLKVDVEGSEVDVLRGAERTLRSTERIILEYHSADLRDRVGALFRASGFRGVLDLDTPASYLPEAGMLYAERAAAPGG